MEAEVAGVRVDEEGVDAREDARAAGDVGREGGAVEGVEVGVGDEGTILRFKKIRRVFDIGNYRVIKEKIINANICLGAL